MLPEEYQMQKEWILIKGERELALAQRYGKIEENLRRHSRALEELPVGANVQIQNQRGSEPLRWNKSGVVVENRGNDQYSIKMDGSGRVTLRNRRYLRRIRPVFEKAVTYGGNIDKEVEYGDPDREPPRRSSRVRVQVQRYQGC